MTLNVLECHSLLQAFLSEIHFVYVVHACAVPCICKASCLYLTNEDRFLLRDAL